MISLLDPVQFKPPWAGAGFVHVRVRTREPFEQVTSHPPQSDHWLHSPSTESQNTHDLFKMIAFKFYSHAAYVTVDT